MKMIALLLVLVSAAFAQDAVVVELSPADAAAAKKAYEAKRIADQTWDDVYAKIQKAHATEGMAAGLKFSKDFRFVVPMATGSGAYGINGFLGSYMYPACSGSWITPTTGTLTIDPGYYVNDDLLPLGGGVGPQVSH